MPKDFRKVNTERVYRAIDDAAADDGDNAGSGNDSDGLRTTILIPQSRYLDLKSLFLIQHPDSLNVLINTALQSYIDANRQAIDEYQDRYGLPPLPKKRGRRK